MWRWLMILNDPYSVFVTLSLWIFCVLKEKEHTWKIRFKYEKVLNSTIARTPLRFDENTAYIGVFYVIFTLY